jgi:hypothetical protein
MCAGEEKRDFRKKFWVGSFTIAVIIGGTPHNSSS